MTGRFPLYRVQLSGLLAELEAMLEAQAQQHRLLQSQRQQERQAIDDERQLLNEQNESLQTALELAEQRIAGLEAESLEARTWAVSVNVQRQIAQEHLIQLQATLTDRRSQLKALGEELEARQESLATQRRLAESQTTVITALQRDLTTAHRTIEALEKQILQASCRQSGMIQLQRTSDLERRSQQIQQNRLEQEQLAFQETIARQAEQLRQAQAETQQWRQRCLAHQHQQQNVQDWLALQGQALSLPEKLQELLSEPLPESFPLLAAPPSELSSQQPSNPGREEIASSGSVLSFPMRTNVRKALPGEAMTTQDAVSPGSDEPEVSPEPKREGQNESQRHSADKDMLELPQFPQ